MLHAGHVVTELHGGCQQIAGSAPDFQQAAGMPSQTTLNQVQIVVGGGLLQLPEMAACLVAAIQAPVILPAYPAQFLSAGLGMQHHVPAVAALHQSRLADREGIIHLPARTDWASCCGGCHRSLHTRTASGARHASLSSTYAAGEGDSTLSLVYAAAFSMVVQRVNCGSTLPRSCNHVGGKSRYSDDLDINRDVGWEQLSELPSSEDIQIPFVGPAPVPGTAKEAAKDRSRKIMHERQARMVLEREPAGRRCNEERFRHAANLVYERGLRGSISSVFDHGAAESDIEFRVTKRQRSSRLDSWIEQ